MQGRGGTGLQEGPWGWIQSRKGGTHDSGAGREVCAGDKSEGPQPVSLSLSAVVEMLRVGLGVKVWKSSRRGVGG